MSEYHIIHTDDHCVIVGLWNHNIDILDKIPEKIWCVPTPGTTEESLFSLTNNSTKKCGHHSRT